MTTPDPRAQPLAVVTGAAGRVGAATVSALNDRYRLRLVDRQWHDADGVSDGVSDGVERRTLDLRSADACAEAIESADVLVHLAGNPQPEQSSVSAIDNVALVGAQLASAIENSSVQHVVYASSIHAMGAYHAAGRFPISMSWPAHPCCEYGAAKVFTEHCFELAAHRSDVSMVGLRMGLIGYPSVPARYSTQWLGVNDYTRMVRAAIRTQAAHAVVFALSAGARSRWDLAETTRVLNMTPQDVPTQDILMDADAARSRGPRRCMMFGHSTPN